ncbi:hypothetical protein LOTGIDRAFT_161901 [Lottia gigantea]|uniref:Neurotransmitter-gated ion-channel ligand-binding domain-containing protein n=1 Tax=Lottia gigantea TaxID=225164 RepID=V4BWH8_LOTGI|nr:hypothetical protein LOTGIDRAFT_161901 [Lottia gigantea]ESO93339.1 hypothetical protein LOTGIDRAFT_161901 [Lottia gigantea]
MVNGWIKRTELSGQNRVAALKGTVESLSDEDKLVKKIIHAYERRGKYGRPVKKYNDTLTVYFSIQLTQIMDLDEKNQVLSLNIWDQYWWKDDHIHWNKEDYGGVEKVRIPYDKIWLPDIKLYNYADLRLEEHRKPLCVFYHTGDIQWMPQVVYRSSCLIDVYKFPFDVQNCSLKFGSWTYNGAELDIEFYEDRNYIDLTEYIESNAWQIIDVPGVKNTEYYTCCPSPFVDITYNLIFQRRATLYNYILILPCVLLTSITLVLFWIPPESPAKMQLGLTEFIAFFVLLKILEKNLPPGTDTMPLLGTYYCLNMIIITLSSFLNVMVVNLNHYGATRSHFPEPFRSGLFNYVAKILLMDSLVSPLRNIKAVKNITTGGSIQDLQADKWNPDPMASTEMLVHLQKDLAKTGGPLFAIDKQLCELRDFIKQNRRRLFERDRKEMLMKEWKAIALILDRIFFVIYLIIIVGSLSYTIPVLTSDNGQNTTALAVAMGKSV